MVSHCFIDFDGHFGSMRLVSCSTRDTVVSSSFKSPASLSCSSARVANSVRLQFFCKVKELIQHMSDHQWWHQWWMICHIPASACFFYYRLQAWSHVLKLQVRNKTKNVKKTWSVSENRYFGHKLPKSFCLPNMLSRHAILLIWWICGRVFFRPEVSPGSWLSEVRWSTWSPS